MKSMKFHMNTVNAFTSFVKGFEHMKKCSKQVEQEFQSGTEWCEYKGTHVQKAVQDQKPMTYPLASQSVINSCWEFECAVAPLI